MRIIKKLSECMRLITLKKQWKQHNIQNNTWLGKCNYTNMFCKKIFDLNYISIGRGTYGPLNIISSDNDYEQLKIGAYCSIGGDTKFILSGGHDYNRLSTYPFRNKYFDHKSEAICKGAIIIDDDVWIADGVTVLSGVHIGQGSVIGAGSIVTKSVPPYSICGGVPCRVIKYRFSDQIIDKLRDIDWEKYRFSPDDLKILETDITDDNVDKLLSYLSNQRDCYKQ